GHFPAPGFAALVGEVPVGIAGSFSQSAAAAHPGAVPALAVEIGEYRCCQKRENGSPEHHEYAQRGTVAHQIVYGAREKIIVLEWPEITEVVLRLVKHEQQARQQKSKTQL